MSVKRFIPAIGWSIFSLVLLCLPGSTIPKYPWLAKIYADKIVHIFLFFILCFLFARGLSQNASEKQRNRWFLLVMLFGIVYGTIMEFVQKYWVANRSFEIWDIVADSVGCFAAWVYSKKRWN